MPRRMLITAGPTHEPIDDVRYIANRSSGKMGIAIAEAAHDAGWEVTLLLGPVSEPRTSVRADTRTPSAIESGERLECGPVGGRRAHESTNADPNRLSAPNEVGGSQRPAANIETVRFTTTEDLRNLLTEHFPKCDVLVMAAAVADYRPVKSGSGKIERGANRLTLELEPTPDLVAECAKRKRPDQFIIGFALEEPDKLRDRALEKLKRKGLDAIVANPLATMGSGTIDGTIYRLTMSGVEESRAALMEKRQFARWFADWLGMRMNRQTQQ